MNFINRLAPILFMIGFLAVTITFIWHLAIQQRPPNPPIIDKAEIGELGTMIDIEFNTIDARSGEEGSSVGTLIFYGNGEIWILSPDSPGVHFGDVVKLKQIKL